MRKKERKRGMECRKVERINVGGKKEGKEEWKEGRKGIKKGTNKQR